MGVLQQCRACAHERVCFSKPSARPHTRLHFIQSQPLGPVQTRRLDSLVHQRVWTRRHAGISAAAGGGDDVPAILVNSCTGKMGHATAEAVVRAGLTLIPYTFTGRSEAVAVGNVGVCGVPVELITQEERQSALERIKNEYPNLVVIDYTLPSAVNGTFFLTVVFYAGAKIVVCSFSFP